MKTYSAAASFDRGAKAKVSDGQGSAKVLAHHVQHSPDGHSWGYNGSGPAELAKDILWDLFGEKPLPPVYQAFKSSVIANLERSRGWSLSETEIRAWLLAHQANEARPA